MKTAITKLPALRPATILFLRLSKDRSDAESIPVQRSNALAFVREMGWADDEVIELADTDESGAEIHKRPGIQKLLRLAEERQGRIRVVMRNQDRLARDGKWTSWLLCELELRGVPEGALWAYDQKRTIETRGSGYAVTAIEAVRAEGEWEATSRRFREALRHRTLEGRATRGAPFGYTLVHEKRNKHWRIDETHAATVILIGETFIASGGSLRQTAKRLNERGVASPKGSTWAPQAVGNILRSPIYRGEVVHGATRRVRQGGSVVKVRAPEEDVLRVQRPELRIWPPKLEKRIDELLARVHRKSLWAPPRRSTSGRRSSDVGHAPAVWS